MAKHAPQDVRQAQILEAALSCFGENGFERTTMADIVTRSGLSKGSLYWHFESKEAILIALFDRYDNALQASWALMNTTPIQTFITRQGTEVFESLLVDRRMVEAWMEFLNHPAARTRMAALYQRYRENLAEALADVTANPAQLAAAIVALIEGLLLQAIVDPDFKPAPVWEKVAPMLLGTSGDSLLFLEK